LRNYGEQGYEETPNRAQAAARRRTRFSNVIIHPQLTNATLVRTSFRFHSSSLVSSCLVTTYFAARPVNNLSFRDDIYWMSDSPIVMGVTNRSSVDRSALQTALLVETNATQLPSP
jgi:hypothetical protein